MTRLELFNKLKCYYANPISNEFNGIIPECISDYIPMIKVVEQECIKSQDNTGCLSKNVLAFCSKFSSPSFNCAVCKTSFNKDFSCKSKAGKSALETHIILLYHDICDFLLYPSEQLNNEVGDFEKGSLLMACKVIEANIIYFDSHTWNN